MFFPSDNKRMSGLVLTLFSIVAGSLVVRRSSNFDGHQISGKIVGLYVFGVHNDMESLALRSPTSPGFIELSFDGEQLGIERIRRPTNWPDGFKFCSSLLPAAVEDFLVNKLNTPIDTVKRIKVHNLADKRIAGCKCYIGLMAQMGFNRVNNRLVENVNTFCVVDYGYTSLFTGTARDQPKTLPLVDLGASIMLKLSTSYTFNISGS